jgi:Na+-transporting NADH:ubiquinone oxidoreductase subunit NqrD
MNMNSLYKATATTSIVYAGGWASILGICYIAARSPSTWRSALVFAIQATLVNGMVAGLLSKSSMEDPNIVYGFALFAIVVALLEVGYQLVKRFKKV